MSKKTVHEILSKGMKDAAFRESLIAKPADALQPYTDRLTAEEMTALQALKPSILEGFGAVLEAAKVARPWWLPASFKELGAGVFSLILVALLLVSAIQAYRTVGTAPIVYTLNETQESIIPFDQAKDLLVILFPIFSAVVTFWLGVAVESKRADQNKETAETEQAAREQAQEEKQRTATDAAETLGRVEGLIMTLPAGGAAFGGELQGEAVSPDPRAEILRIVREGQRAIRR